ncbi:MAG: hypothetical protein WBK46_05985, partial [Ruminococcus flavefaciens]
EKKALYSSLAKLYSNLLILYSRHQKELTEYKKRIFEYNWLLKYNANPRVKIIYCIRKILGINMTVKLLHLIDR